MQHPGWENIAQAVRHHARDPGRTLHMPTDLMKHDLSGALGADVPFSTSTLFRQNASKLANVLYCSYK
jgi:hypothetical protein